MRSGSKAIGVPMLAALLFLLPVHQPTAQPTGLEFGRLGTVTLYQPEGTPRELVLFISGDGGWTPGVAGMAGHLRDRGALVAGIDINQLRKGMRDTADDCTFVAGDLEEFAHAVERRYRFPQYVNPILAGYSSGATLAYVALVQSPGATFKGTLSLGFCPELKWKKPFCRGDGKGLASWQAGPDRFRFEPVPDLTDRWIVLQGGVDAVCDPAVAQGFVERMRGAQFVQLPKVGHGFSVERNYLAEFLAAYDRLAAANQPAGPSGALPMSPDTGVTDLPLIELPSAGPATDLIAIMLSGDGGWAGLDRELAADLAARGVKVVGWDSLRYFWSAKTPDAGAIDLGRIIRHYTQKWHRSRVVVIGYSMGADNLPFMVNRLNTAAGTRIVLVALLAPGRTAQFEFHLSQWLQQDSPGLAVAPEIARLGASPGVCIYGRDEESSACTGLKGGPFRTISLPGGHHFDGDYQTLARIIIEAIGGPVPQ